MSKEPTPEELRAALWSALGYLIDDDDEQAQRIADRIREVLKCAAGE